VGVCREGDTLVPIIARAPEAERDEAAALDGVQVHSPTAGRYLPVGQPVTGTGLEWVDAITRRIDRFPTIKAQADPPPGELSGPVLQRFKPGVEVIEVLPGYALEWHGEDKAAREANKGLALSAPYGFSRPWCSPWW
jgi:multidrug efflux pump subunit AcrB